MLRHSQSYRDKSSKRWIQLSLRETKLFMHLANTCDSVFFFCEKYSILVCKGSFVGGKKSRERNEIKKCVREPGNIGKISYIFRIDTVLTQALLNVFLFPSFYRKESRILHWINSTTCDLIRLYRYKMYHKTQNEIIAVSPYICNKHRRYIFAKRT